MIKNVHGGDIYRNEVNIDFSVNVNPLGVHPQVQKAMADALDRVSCYPDIASMSLSCKLAEYYGASAEQIIVGNGASELILASIQAFKPHRVLIPAPAFMGYEHAVSSVEAEIIYYKMANFVPDEGLLACLNADIDMLILTNPCNPSGKCIDENLLKHICDKCGEYNIKLLLDECFIELCDIDEKQNYDDKKNYVNHMLVKKSSYVNLFVVSAFTKSFAIPGARIGYMICPDLSNANKIKCQLPEWNISVIAQAAGEACCDILIQDKKSGDAGYLAKSRKLIREEKKYLIAQLREIVEEVFDSDANYILFYDKMFFMCERLKKAGILIRDCSNYEGLSEGFYRIAVRSHEDNEKLIDAIKDVKISR